MENSEKDLGRWVDDRMALLMESGDYRLDVEHALGRLWTWGEAPASRQTDGHLDRLLAPQVEVPWFVGLWQSLRERLHPEPLPPLDVTSRPVAVKDIWGLYPTRSKSMLYSLALQGAVVALTFVTVTSPVVQQKMRDTVSLVAPVLRPLDMKPQKNALQGGGGGGDRSPLPAAKGKLPKIAMRQFVPPTEVVLNEHPKLTMEPTIVAPPDTVLPSANLANIGDPLAKLGPPSNGMGSGGGIGNGKGGGIGSGDGAGLGPGSGGGFGGGVFRTGGGVSAPSVLSRVEPEYSEEARKAKYSGTVVLSIIVDTDGSAKSIHVSRSVGLGLDEKAVEAVQKWKFLPGKKDGHPVAVFATVEVNFRLL